MRESTPIRPDRRWGYPPLALFARRTFYCQRPWRRLPLPKAAAANKEDTNNASDTKDATDANADATDANAPIPVMATAGGWCQSIAKQRQ